MSSIPGAQRAAQTRPHALHMQTLAAPLVALIAAAPPVHAQPSEREVSLEELLAYAAEHGPAVAVARAARAQGDAALAAAEPALRDNPTVEFGIGPRFVKGGGGPSVDVVAALAQPIEIAGQRGARLRAARALGAKLQADADVAGVELRRSVALAYAEASAARERALFAAQLARFAGELMRVSERRLEAGDANLIEVRVAQADAAAAELERLEAEGALRAAQLELCAESGWPIAAPPLPRARAVDGAPEVPELAALVRAARARHPELRAQHAAVAQANAERDVAEREAWPTPAIGVAYEHESSAFDPDNDIVLGTIELPLPLFDRNQGKRATADADATRARAERDAAARQLEGRIAAAHAALQAAASRLALFAAQIGPRLEESLALLERGFTAGEIPLLEVLTVRERLLSGKRAALDAGADFVRARAELEYAIGSELPVVGGAR